MASGSAVTENDVKAMMKMPVSAATKTPEDEKDISTALTASIAKLNPHKRPTPRRFARALMGNERTAEIRSIPTSVTFPSVKSAPAFPSSMRGIG